MHSHRYFNWLAGSEDKEGSLNHRNLSPVTGLSPTTWDLSRSTGHVLKGAILMGRIWLLKGTSNYSFSCHSPTWSGNPNKGSRVFSLRSYYIPCMTFSLPSCLHPFFCYNRNWMWHQRRYCKMKGVLAGKLIVKQQPNILEEFMYEEKKTIIIPRPGS